MLDLVARTEIAGAGFINIFLTPAARQAVVPQILAERERYGTSSARRRRATRAGRVRVRQSHRPAARRTWPSGGALGDALATLLQHQGAGRDARVSTTTTRARRSTTSRCRCRRAGATVLGEHARFPEDGYHGEYIRELAQRYPRAAGRRSRRRIRGDPALRGGALRREQDVDLRAFGVRFDKYYLESSLYADGRVERRSARLAGVGHDVRAEGALWLKTTDYGDDKDRVMRKSDGGYTYFVPDVAYHVTKWERGFAKAINVQGSDHHGTVARVRAGLQAWAWGFPTGYPDYVLHKMVTVMRGGEEVKISKRAGSLCDAARPDR